MKLLLWLNINKQNMDSKEEQKYNIVTFKSIWQKEYYDLIPSWPVA